MQLPIMDHAITHAALNACCMIGSWRIELMVKQVIPVWMVACQILGVGRSSCVWICWSGICVMMHDGYG